MRAYRWPEGLDRRRGDGLAVLPVEQPVALVHDQLFHSCTMYTGKEVSTRPHSQVLLVQKRTTETTQGEQIRDWFCQELLVHKEAHEAVNSHTRKRAPLPPPTKLYLIHISEPTRLRRIAV